MIGNTLQRQIFWELTRVFVLALVTLTSLFLLAGVVQEATQRGLTPSQILGALPLLIPNSLPYTVPATTLFAACVVYGRMAHDNEITALRSAGVHLGRLLLPGLVFGVITSFATFALYCNFIPRSQQMLTDRLLEDIDELLLTVLKRQGCLRSGREPFSMFVRDVRGQRLIGPVFKKRRDDGRTYSLVAHAKEATLWTDVPNGLVYVFMPSCSVVGDEGVDGSVRDQTFSMPLPLHLFRDGQIRPSKMGWGEIRQKWDEVLEDMPARQAHAAAAEQAMKATTAPPPAAVQHYRDMSFHESEGRRAVRGFATEFNLRPALSLSGVVFVLVAFPVGIWFHRADYLSAFVSCFLPVVFVYYPLLLTGTNLARNGSMPAVVAIWAADLVALALGGLMLRKLFRQ